MDAQISPVLDLPTGPAEIAGVPHQRLLSSSASGWSDIFAASYTSFPHTELHTIPEQLQPFHTIYLHKHPTPIELWCDFDGHTVYAPLRPGALILGPALVPTAFAWNSQIHTINISLTQTLIASSAAAISKTDPAKLELIPRINFDDPLILHICLALLAELEAGGPAGPLYSDTLGQALALHLLRSSATGIVLQASRVHSLSQSQIRRVVDSINDQIDHKFTLGELAAIAGLSPTYFARQFKQAIGMAPHQYLIHRRVERASLLLARGNTTVAEVAQLVGFADQSHLNRHFKRLIGVAPVALLKDRKNVQEIGWNVQDNGKLAKVS